jgi:hypothetical protein
LTCEPSELRRCPVPAEYADPPRLHGPNHQWTRKKDGKTATRIPTDDQLADYQLPLTWTLRPGKFVLVPMSNYAVARSVSSCAAAR